MLENDDGARETQISRLEATDTQQMLSDRTFRCGCGLHEKGCFEEIVSKVGIKLVDVRTANVLSADVGQKHLVQTAQLKAMIRAVEMAPPERQLSRESGASHYFDYAVEGISVCRVAYEYAYHIPRQTLAARENDAVAGKFHTRNAVEREWRAQESKKQHSAFASSKRDLAFCWALDFINEMAELQPNGPSEGTRHMDKWPIACSVCKNAVRQSGADVDTRALCLTVATKDQLAVCLYGHYVTFALRDVALDPSMLVKTTLFREEFLAAMRMSNASFRQHKGVSSDCPFARRSQSSARRVCGLKRSWRSSTKRKPFTWQWCARFALRTVKMQSPVPGPSVGR